MSYKTWTNKIDMWKVATVIPKEQQATIVLLESLEGNAKAEKAVSELTATDVNYENGMNLLIEKFDNYLKVTKSMRHAQFIQDL